MADDHFLLIGCVTRQHRRRPVVNTSRHQHRPGADVLVTCAVQMRPAQLAVAATEQSAPTAERVDEALAELGAHEAVRDRVAAGRYERQQVDVVHRRRTDVRHGVGVVEDAPRLHDVHRRPADEEQDDHDRQHLNAASLRANAAGSGRPHVAGADQLVSGGRRAGLTCFVVASSTRLSRLCCLQLVAVADVFGAGGARLTSLRFSSSPTQFRQPHPIHAVCIIHTSAQSTVSYTATKSLFESFSFEIF